MKQDRKDSGLRKALHSKHSALPSNFTFRTMQKIEEDIRHRETKRERRMFCCAIAVSVLLMTWCGLIIRDHYGEELQILFYELAVTFIQMGTEVFPYCNLVVIFFIFLLLDHWMRKYYFKHQKEHDPESSV